MTETPLERAKALLDSGRLEEAVRLTTPLAEAPDAPIRALAIHSTGLKGLGRREEALVFDREATRRFPANAAAWHNLAATLGDLGKGAAAVEAMERAMRLGLDGGLSWSVMARARAAAGDLDGAEAAYLETLRRAPASVETAVEYSEIIWMRRGDLDAAQGVLDRCAHLGGDPEPLLIAKAKLFDAAGKGGQGADLLLRATAMMPEALGLKLVAAQAELERGRIAEAETLVLAASAQAPDAQAVLNQLAIVYLAAGRADEALRVARRGLALDASNQSLWGWAATAARIVGDPLHRELYDYDSMVRPYDIETPEGWPSLTAYLGDLAKALDRLHLYTEHPANQSLRHGSQTTYRLTGSDDPAIQAFFRAIDAPIRAHIAGLGEGRDPVRARRVATGYRIEAAWSVRLRPGGFHKDHFHPEGWLSSAFYVETPETALDSPDREGWIRFGRPPFLTQPPLEAEHYVRPKPGRLVLFPSYMWHGTVPFTTDERRMTIAFDIVPA